MALRVSKFPHRDSPSALHAASTSTATVAERGSQKAVHAPPRSLTRSLTLWSAVPSISFAISVRPCASSHCARMLLPGSSVISSSMASTASILESTSPDR